MKRIFVDTSAVCALMDKNDKFHRAAADNFSQFAADTTVLACSSYVVLETVALLQSRIGMGPVKKWQSEFQPILEIVWVDADLHEKALTALIAAQDRSISLTDWTSFEIMRERGIEEAFSFDRHFSQRGFNLLPSPRDG